MFVESTDNCEIKQNFYRIQFFGIYKIEGFSKLLR